MISLFFDARPFTSSIDTNSNNLGGDSPFVENLGSPVMLPQESNPDKFNIPPGVFIDNTMTLVDEANQVDTVILNNLDVRGNLPSVGIFTNDQFEGMNMANGISILGSEPYSGILYEEIEVFTFNLGDGIDNIVSRKQWIVL